MKLSIANHVQLLHPHLKPLCTLLVIIAGCGPQTVDNSSIGVPDVSVTIDGVVMPPPNENEFTRHCPADAEIVPIKEADPQNEEQHKAMLKRLREKPLQDNTTILIGENVILDFTNVTGECLHGCNPRFLRRQLGNRGSSLRTDCG